MPHTADFETCTSASSVTPASKAQPRVATVRGQLTAAPASEPATDRATGTDIERRQAETVLARLLAGAEAKKPERRGRLPVGLTETELQQGYSRVPHPVEVVAMGFLIACAAACAMGVWPWPLVAVRGL